MNRAVIHDAAFVASRAIEESLRIELTMGLSRLADPVKSMGHENLSFAKVADSAAGAAKEAIEALRGKKGDRAAEV